MFSPAQQKTMIEKLKKLKSKGKNWDGLASGRNSPRSESVSETPDAMLSPRNNRRKPPRPLIDLKIRTLTKDSIESFITLQNSKGDTVRKLADAASKFRPDRDGQMLSAFETSSLDYKDFRVMLKRVFFLEFADTEFVECCDLFDANNDGDIDGEEFLVGFTLLSSVWRDRERRKAREFSRRIEEEEREKELKAAAEREAKLEEAADFIFSAEDGQSVQTKIATAAKLFDKNTSTVSSLEGFDAKYLKPGHFRDNMRLAFGIQLTRKELGALVKLYEYVEGLVPTGLVDCRLFMTAFTRMGVESRRDDHVKQLEKNRQEQQKAREEQEKMLNAIEQKEDVEIDYNFSEKDRESVLNKITLIAVNYNRSQLGLDGFNGTYLAPGLFKEMVKRTFNLQLTPKELGAAVRHFDVDHNGKVSCQAFLVYFSKSALLEKNRIHAEQCELSRKVTVGFHEEQEKKIADKWKKHELKPADFEAVTEADVKSALDKFSSAAMRIDKKSTVGANLYAAFQGSHLIPPVFKEVCRRCLEVTLTNTELAAMVMRYDHLGDRSEVDCNKFMNEFSAMSFKELGRLRERQRKQGEALDKQKQDEEQARLDQTHKHELHAADFHFSEEDKAVARAKFKFAASRFDKSNKSSSNVLAILQGQSVKVALIKEMLKKGMQVEFSAKEFGSLIQPFLLHDEQGEENSRLANSAELLKLFVQLQNEYREEQRQKRIEAERALHHARAEEERKREEDARAKSESKLKHKDEDEKTLMVKLKRVAQSFVFDSSAYIPLLQSFKGPPMTPSVFSDTFFRVFLVRLTVPEVAVIMREVNHETAKQHLVDGASFVKTFLKISRLVEKILLGLMDDELVDINVFHIVDDKPAAASAGNSQQEKQDKEKKDKDDADGGGGGGAADSAVVSKKKQSWLKELLNGTNPYTDIGIAAQGYSRDFGSSSSSRRSARPPRPAGGAGAGDPLNNAAARLSSTMPSSSSSSANYSPLIPPLKPIVAPPSSQQQRAQTAPSMKRAKSGTLPPMSLSQSQSLSNSNNNQTPVRPATGSSPPSDIISANTTRSLSPLLIVNTANDHDPDSTATKQDEVPQQQKHPHHHQQQHTEDQNVSFDFSPLPGEVGTWASSGVLLDMDNDYHNDLPQQEAEERRNRNKETNSNSNDSGNRPFSAAGFTLDTWFKYRQSRRKSSPGRQQRSPAKTSSLSSKLSSPVQGDNIDMSISYHGDDADAHGTAGVVSHSEATAVSPFLRRSRPRTFNSVGFQRRGISSKKIANMMHRPQAITANLSSTFEAVAENVGGVIETS